MARAELLPFNTEAGHAAHAYNDRTDTPAFTTPASTMTRIGFILNFRSSTTHSTNIAANIQLVPASDISYALPQSAVISTEIPADAIIATTAGRREFRIP